MMMMMMMMMMMINLPFLFVAVSALELVRVSYIPIIGNCMIHPAIMHDVVLLKTHPRKYFTFEMVPKDDIYVGMFDLLKGDNVDVDIRLCHIDTAIINPKFRHFLKMTPCLSTRLWVRLPKRELCSKEEIKEKGGEDLWKLYQEMEDWKLYASPRNKFHLYKKNCKHFSRACVDKLSSMMLLS
jgi:hypothetical protein